MVPCTCIFIAADDQKASQHATFAAEAASGNSLASSACAQVA